MRAVPFLSGEFLHPVASYRKRRTATQGDCFNDFKDLRPDAATFIYIKDWLYLVEYNKSLLCLRQVKTITVHTELGTHAIAACVELHICLILNITEPRLQITKGIFCRPTG